MLFSMLMRSFPPLPKKMKEAKIVSLLNKGNRSCCENYRVTSLLNASYKLYMKINKRLKYFRHIAVRGTQRHGI
jgi:hypothetical protein